jgi:hypothetical protein
MIVVNTHVLIEDNGTVGRFEELDDGRFIYLHRKLSPMVLSKEDFEIAQSSNTLPKRSSLT